VTAWLPGATIGPGKTAILELVLRTDAAAASLEWTVASSGEFLPSVTPSSGAVSLPANGIVRIPLTVGVPSASIGLGAVTIAVVYANGGGRVATTNASIIAATDGRPEIWPVSPTWSATAGTSGSVHTALTVALALAPLAVEPSQEHSFITQFLAQWGGGAPSGKRLPRRRRSKR
jgi:hypothetical protein